jgi:nucleotide-binding universal stress UspA family protein
MFHRVLVPVDGSAASRSAARLASQMLSGEDGALAVIVVAISPIDSGTVDIDELSVDKKNEQMRRDADSVLAEATRVFEEHGVLCSSKVITGDPVSAAIAAEASSDGYDLIVMASKGLGMSRNDTHYLGSVTEHVVRRVNIPVLVLPQHAK